MVATGLLKDRFKPIADALAPLVERFTGQPALVFAAGPSLPTLWSADRPLPCPAIAVNDAWRIVPAADVLYASDMHWWRYHQGVPAFRGAKVGCYECRRVPGVLNLEMSGEIGFDQRLGSLRHGHSSGCAAIHLAAQLGSCPIVLVGFDYRRVRGKLHFFGEHPTEIAGRNRREPGDPLWDLAFNSLAEELERRSIRVLNATPDSALRAFPSTTLEALWPALS